MDRPPSPTPHGPARGLPRDTLLDGMAAELGAHGWSEITMAGVAHAAGVSRQTLYNEFGSRQGFLQAYVLREVDRFLAAVERAVIAHHDDPPRALSAAFTVFLAAAGAHPLVRAVVSGEGADDLLPLVTTQGEPVLGRATERLAAILIVEWPGVGEQDARLLAESVVRLAISHVVLPSGPASMTAASVTDLLAPYVERALEGVAPASREPTPAVRG